MKSLLIAVATLAAAGTALPQSTSPALSGTWVLQKDNTVKLVVEQTPDKIHVKELKGDQVRSDYTCNLDGKDCSVKEDGHSEKVALWFNGPKLVEMITRGSEVSRKRFTLADGGKTLQVELAPMSTQGKTEILAYSR
jgi:hypothetical protein